MIRGLRKRLISEAGVNVGILQRESLLATNRGKARIDPRASAQLAVGEEQDILSSVQQLAQLYAVAQSGGALGFFGALQKQPREPQPEIYALTTGNKFEVAPIFDPSGQALRFKFDFVGTSKVQEQAFSGPLVDQNGRWVHYVSLMNRREFDYIVSPNPGHANEGLYNLEGQVAFVRNH